MAKVTGFGGVFWKSADRAATARWFTEVLGLPTEEWGRVFPWSDGADAGASGYTVLGLHAESSDYFAPSERPFMINLRVDDLAGMLAQLRARGVAVVKEFPADDNGRFAHVMGPDGVKIELWEPAKE